jgi:hypothetical protein
MHGCVQGRAQQKNALCRDLARICTPPARTAGPATLSCCAAACHRGFLRHAGERTGLWGGEVSTATTAPSTEYHSRQAPRALDKRALLHHPRVHIERKKKRRSSKNVARRARENPASKPAPHQRKQHTQSVSKQHSADGSPRGHAARSVPLTPIGTHQAACPCGRLSGRVVRSGAGSTGKTGQTTARTHTGMPPMRRPLSHRMAPKQHTHAVG